MNVDAIITAIKEAGHLTLQEAAQIASAVRDSTGWGNWDHLSKRMNRQRVHPGREKRKQPSKSVKQRLYDRQEGMCAWCPGKELQRLIIPANRNEADHFNPHRQDFNAQDNWVLLLPECNRIKGSTPLIELARRTGITLPELIQRARI